MRLAELMAGLLDPARAMDGETLVRGITADSRRVTPGDVFAALPGGRLDGRRFIAEAVARGASAVLAPPGTAWPAGVPPRPLIEDEQPRRRLAQFAARLAGAQPAVVVAITGTNGKTSSVDFLRQIWAGAGSPAASLGTLGLCAPGFATGPGLTTPDPVALAGTLADLARAGITHVAMEASSHGLDQFRLDGVRLAAGGFCNLTRDHLDYHGSLEAYATAKLRLFADLLPPGAFAVASSALHPPTLERLRAIAAARRLDLRLVGEAGDAIVLHRAMPQPDGQTIEFTAQGRRQTLFLPLPGRFQADNALLAAALAMALGSGDALAMLERLAPVPGRLQRAAQFGGAAVYVDYAHTPDALARLIAALRPHVGPGGRLHLVFGAGGERDAGKRPLMGAAAAAADRVIVTDDNPRGEDAGAIRAAVRAGCPEAAEIADRASAIAAAMSDLRPGDVLAVAGKGHEQGQIVGNQVLPFDDVAMVRQLAGSP